MATGRDCGSEGRELYHRPSSRADRRAVRAERDGVLQRPGNDHPPRPGRLNRLLRRPAAPRDRAHSLEPLRRALGGRRQQFLARPAERRALVPGAGRRVAAGRGGRAARPATRARLTLVHRRDPRRHAAGALRAVRALHRRLRAAAHSSGEPGGAGLAGSGKLGSARRWRRQVGAAAAPTAGVGTIAKKRERSTAATTPARLPPKPTSTVVRPSSTSPRPPGVIGIEPSTRASDQPANASARLISEAPTPSARRQASSTRKTDSWPASVASVSTCQRLRSSPIAPPRKRARLSPAQPTGPRRTHPSTQLRRRAARLPTRRAIPALESAKAKPPATTTNRARPTVAIVFSAAPLPPVRVSSASASVGKKRIASWFQTPVSVTARATSLA